MSARSPFRSHLLQQWIQSRRSPIAVQPWLRQATIDEEEGDLSSRTPRSSRRNQEMQSRGSLHHSSPQYNPRTLPSVDSSSSSSSSSTPSIAFATKMFASPLKFERDDHVNNVDTIQFTAGSKSLFDSSNARIETRTQQGEREHLQHGQKNDSLRHSTGKSHPERMADKMGPQLKAMQEPASFRPPFAKNIRDQETRENAFASAKTAKNEEKEDRKALCVAIDRAVTKLSERRVVQNHPPFTFRRFFSSSQSGLRLIDICFHVVLRQTKDSSMAMIERNKWLAVPAFLVALVHDNQSDDIEKDVEPYEELDYSPPAMEGQLEDVRPHY